MKVSFEGFSQGCASFYNAASGSAVKGAPAKMTGSGTVGVCAAGDVPAGVCIEVDENFASLILGGYVTLPYTGTTAPAVGFGTMAADGTGGMKVVTTGGKSYLILDVDTTAKTVGFIL